MSARVSMMHNNMQIVSKLPCRESNDTFKIVKDEVIVYERPDSGTFFFAELSFFTLSL